jgi:hypothetical protein
MKYSVTEVEHNCVLDDGEDQDLISIVGTPWGGYHIEWSVVFGDQAPIGPICYCPMCGDELPELLRQLPGILMPEMAS